MLLKKPDDVRARDITPRDMYLRRREFLRAAGIGAAAAMTGDLTFDAPVIASGAADAPAKLTIAKKMVTTDEPLTSFKDVTTFNNYYEFGSDKNQPAKTSKNFKPKPWSVVVEGECAKPGTYTLEDILKPHAIEERVYRHRCVEGWSMVIPWAGFPLGDLLKRFQPTGNAKFVEFTTIKRPSEMPEQNRWLYSILPWPYVEGLRIDEAMHPLALMAVGLYGAELPNQNGAPLRLVVPWKYGFKSIKSIVKIRFTGTQPQTTWQRSEPQFYGFYSNVNPGVTGSSYRNQSVETVIGRMSVRSGENEMIRTRLFNGYEKDVASLYAGMNLKLMY